jgi:integrase
MANELNDAKIDLHNGLGRAAAARKRLETAPLPKSDKEAIANFINSISASEALSPGREAKVMDELRKIRLTIKKSFKAVKRADLETWMLTLNKGDLRPDTQADYRKDIKRFYRWYYEKLGCWKPNGDGRGYPDIVAWIHEPRKETNRNGVCREVLLEEAEVLKIIGVTDSSMWRAFFWILWEAGLRPGELLNLRVRDVEPTDSGIRINVRYGKTGARKLPLAQARQAVLAWLDLHKKKTDLTAPLFPISYMRALQAAGEFGKKANIIGKRTGLKYWRKSRATYLARFMSQAQLQYWFGWSSPKTSVAYVFASEKDVLGTILDINNIRKPEKQGMAFRVCDKCGERNTADKTLCGKCAFPLTIEGAIKLEEQKKAELQNVVAEQLESFKQAMAKEMLAKAPNSPVIGKEIVVWKGENGKHEVQTIDEFMEEFGTKAKGA